MEIPFILPNAGNSSPKTPWDEYCPIIETDFGYRVFMTDGIDAPDVYNQLYHILRDASANKTIEFIINNGGGHADTAFMLSHAIKNSKAKTVAVVSGTVASAATIIALACKKLEVTPYLSFMVHNYSGSIHGKGNELKARQEFADRELDNYFRDIYKGFLTEEEMEKVIDGTDMWLGTNEVKTRWANRNKKPEVSNNE